MPKRNRSDDLVGRYSSDRGTITRATDTDLWSRMKKRRLEDCDSLGDELIETIIAGIKVDGLQDETSSKDKFELILQHHFRAASNPTLPAEKRRFAWNTVSNLLRNMDTLLGRQQEERASSDNGGQSSSVLARVDLGQTASSERQRPSKRPAVPAIHPSLQRVANKQGNTNNSINTNGSVAAAADGSDASTTQQVVHPSLQKTAVIHPSLIHPSLQNKNPNSQSGVTSTSTNTVQTTASTRPQPIHPSLQRNNTRAGKSKENEHPQVAETSQNTTSRPNAKETAKPDTSTSAGLVEKPPTVQEKPTLDTSDTCIDFVADPESSPYSQSMHKRGSVKVTYRKIKRYPPSMVKEAALRFSTWEPNWTITTVIQMGLTSTVDRCHNKTGTFDPTTVPKTVASFPLNEQVLQSSTIDAVKNWGKEGGTPKEGEYRLLLRMLPMDSKSNKNIRADCHQWPKGTFLTLNGKPMTGIFQRKQCNTDFAKWKGMSRHLDLGSRIKFPVQKHKIELCCRDSEQYWYLLALCKFRSPDSLLEQIMNPDNNTLCRLSLEESIEKAKVSATVQTVVLDDDEVVSAETGMFVFSLICPVSKIPMTTPVRGVECKHWQVRIFVCMFCKKK